MKLRTQATLALVAAALLGLAALAFWLVGGAAETTYLRANVLLITIDTMRADRLGAYGHAAAVTPRIDALASDGIRFEQAVSPMPLTLPSHASLMTSLSTAAHGVRDNAAFELSPDLQTLAGALRGSGYATGAFVGAFVLHSRWGLNRGFDHYDDTFDYEDGSTSGQVERRADAVVDATLGWLREAREAPFFAWVHLYDPHSPYAAPDPYPGRFPGRPYDAEVAYTDAQIGRLLDAMDSAGLMDDTIVVVTADHGEGLGDHGEPGHGMFLYDTTLLVPLIIRLPDRRAAGREVPEQVRLIDVAPTIVELVDVDVPESFGGETLQPFFDGPASPRPAYSETYYPRWHFGWQELHALRKDGFKYVQAPREELYDVREDPGETRNLAAADPTRAAAYEREVEELRGENPAGPSRLSADAASRLRALGYISGAPVETGDGPLPDPKDKMHLFTRITDGQSQLVAGQFADAVATLNEVVAEDARIPSAWVTLGNALFRLGRFREAVDAFRSGLELSPDDDVALLNLGLSHRRLGERDTARSDFEAVLAVDASSAGAHFNLGEMALEDGDPVAAVGHFDAAVRINDKLPGPRFGLGVAAYQIGDVRRAEEEFDRVDAMAPEYPELQYYRALIAEARADPATAEQLYRAELDHHAAHHRSWFNLSQLQAQRGDHAAAVESLRRAVETDPGRAPAYILLARSLLALADPGGYAEAEAAAKKGLSLDPPLELRPLGHYVLADIYNRLGRPADAQREAELARQAERRIGR